MKKHYKPNFFLLEGRNGATYILNAQNTDSLSTSLKFYTTLTLKQKVMKMALMFYVRTLKVLCSVSPCLLKSQEEVQMYLKQLTDLPMGFELDNNCSILISSTRNKIIVHHHRSHFHKFAFGISYTNVKNEANIYALLSKPFQHFRVSPFCGHEDHATYCSFKLGSQSAGNMQEVDLVSALVELFSVTKVEEQRFGTYLQRLRDRYKQSLMDDTDVLSTLESLEKSYANERFPLGLVHRDFKHWNTNTDNGLLIYDFEEAVTDGPAMEDLFNYTVSPVLAYLSIEEVAEKLWTEPNKRAYKAYLEQLGLNIDTQALLCCYLVERALFYSNLEDSPTSKKYIKLLHYMNAQKNKERLL